MLFQEVFSFLFEILHLGLPDTSKCNHVLFCWKKLKKIFVGVLILLDLVLIIQWQHQSFNFLRLQSTNVHVEEVIEYLNIHKTCPANLFKDSPSIIDEQFEDVQTEIWNRTTRSITPYNAIIDEFVWFDSLMSHNFDDLHCRFHIFCFRTCPQSIQYGAWVNQDSRWDHLKELL